jgi:pimeloyl-ACP methyl ester carboxylesterase
MAQAALRRKPGFATREEAFAAYRGRGAFRSWPDETLRGYLEDGLMPVARGFALSCAPAWEAANFASYAMDDPTGALGSVGVPIRILRAGVSSTCVLEEARGHVRIDTIEGSSHFLPMERPEVVGQALKEAVLF